MNKQLKITFFSSILFLTISCAFGMEAALPENTKICARAALSVYGDEYAESKKGTTTLVNSGYTTQEIYKNPAVELRMDL